MKAKKNAYKNNQPATDYGRARNDIGRTSRWGGFDYAEPT